MLLLWFVANTLLVPINVSLGGFRLGLNVVVLILAGSVWFVLRAKITGFSAKALLVLCMGALLSCVVALIGPCDDKLLKLVITAPIFLFLILLGFEAGWKAGDKDWLFLQKVANWVLLVAFASFIVEAVFPSFFPNLAGYRSEGKLTGMFGEPSHATYFIFPWIAILLVGKDERLRRNGMFALFGLLLLSRSSTLIALIGAWILYRMVIQGRFRQSLLIVLAMGLLIFLGSVIDYDQIVNPTVERVVGIFSSSEVENISSLVYLQGWQDAWSNLQRTNGIGLGFNMMGCNPIPDVPAREILSRAQLDLNAEDGSFLFSKIISEAGVFGFMLFVMAIWWWIKLEQQIKKCNDMVSSEIGRIHSVIMFCFVASSFVRSMGYFDGVLFFWIAALAGSLKWYMSRQAILSGKKSSAIKCV
jgi:hypothetical protein